VNAIIQTGRAEVMFKGQSKKMFSRLARQIHFPFHEQIKSGCPKVRKTAAKTSDTFILCLNSNLNNSQTMSNPWEQNPPTYENVITCRHKPVDIINLFYCGFGMVGTKFQYVLV
jgi:hypothetical protein